jgi:hypothetical protein
MSAIAAMTHKPLSVPRMGGIKIVLLWIVASLAAFPLSGLLGWTVGGHVDGVGAALIGGAVTGAGIGLVQWIFLRRDLGMSFMWIVDTSIGLAVGLSIGAAVVGYGTSASDLAIMGAITGAAVGIAQGVLLLNRFTLWGVWMVAMPALFALGWFVTEAAGIKVEEQWPVFGASGTVVFGILSGLLLMAGKRPQDARM